MQIENYTLKNSRGLSVNFINYGGILTHLFAPDKNGQMGDVLLGFDDVATFAKTNPSYYGTLVGRFANRIGGARFTIDGETYPLFKNDGENSLHGGKLGFDKVAWTVEEIEPAKSYRLTYTSRDMEEGYPGNLKTEVVYSLNDANEFSIDYTAKTDRATHINLTSHGYFNLSGVPGTDMLDHELTIDADTYTVSNASYIPTGEIRALEPALDFRKPMTVGKHIAGVHEGYNHNYILNHPGRTNVVATVHHPRSGRFMEMMTTEPGVQFYSAYFLDPTLVGKGGQIAPRYGGLCLEAQHYPDSPNQPTFPSTLLRPGETYRQTTTYRFGVRA